MVVAVGTGRCGTAYTAALLQALGLDVAHEQWGKAGISASQVATDRHRRNLQWAEHVDGQSVYVLHLTRDPVRTISSMMGRPQTFIKMVEPGVMPDGVSDLDGLARYYVWWNEQIEESFPVRARVQIEQLRDWIPELCRWLGITLTPERNAAARAVPTNYGTAHASVKRHGLHRYERVYTWGDVAAALPESVAAPLRAMAKRYGYQES